MIEQKHTEAIAKYISARLGSHGIRWFDINWAKAEKRSYKWEGTCRLDKKQLGIFSHALLRCDLNILIWWDSKDESPTQAIVSTQLSYEHIGHGTNGCDLDVNLVIDLHTCEIQETE